jgi:hypothetical protein
MTDRTLEQVLAEMRSLHIDASRDRCLGWADAIEAELKERKLAVKDFILHWRVSSGLHAQQILDELEVLYQIEPSDHAERHRFTAEERGALESAAEALGLVGSNFTGVSEIDEQHAATIRAMLEEK